MSEIETNIIDPSTSSPGAILKRCREYHEISLEEAEEATKIGANHLQALEEDQIGKFASVAYLKGFLRIYTVYLGLNPDDMIRLYDKLYTTGNTQLDGNKIVASSEAPRKKKFPLQKLVMPATILILIIITSAIVNRKPSTSLSQNPPIMVPAPISAPVVQSVISSAKQPSEAKKTVNDNNIQQQDALPAGQNKINPAQKSEAAKSFIVRMKVIQSGTLSVTIDGTTSQNYDLAVGDSIEWKADRSIILELSNSAGVEVDLNGKQLKPFGQPGKPAIIELDAEGVKQ